MKITPLALVALAAAFASAASAASSYPSTTTTATPATTTSTANVPPPGSVPASSPDSPHTDFSLYFFSTSMDGQIVVQGRPSDINLSFNDVWDHMEFGAMARGRVVTETASIGLDVMYLGLGATATNGAHFDFDQWIVEPVLGYRLTPWFELIGGVRASWVTGNVRYAPTSTNEAGTHSFVAPFIGGHMTLTFARSFDFEARADVGGFKFGCDLTWEVEAGLRWRFTPTMSTLVSYRAMYFDYTDDAHAFRYDVTLQGPQIAFTKRF